MIYMVYAPVVQWIELRTSKPSMLVRFQPGALERKVQTALNFPIHSAGRSHVFPLEKQARRGRANLRAAASRLCVTTENTRSLSANRKIRFRSLVFSKRQPGFYFSLFGRMISKNIPSFVRYSVTNFCTSSNWIFSY